MYPSVAMVAPRGDFTLETAFDNGEEGVLDMKLYLNFGAFPKIANYEYFKRVRVAFDTVEWDCDVDLDPEFVYNKCKITAQT